MLTSVKAYEKEGKLTEAERRLIDAVRAGEDCELSTTRPEVASDANTIRAGLLALLITGGADGDDLGHHGVNLSGAYVKGQLRLTHQVAVGVTWLLACSFAESIDLRQAKFSLLSLNDCHLPGLSAQGAEVTADLLLRGISATRPVNLKGAQVGGQLDLKAARLDGNGRRALNAQSIVIAESLFITDCKIKGTIYLAGARIGGQLACMNSTLDGKGVGAFDAQAATVGASLIWRNVTIKSGAVSLAGAHSKDLFDDVGNWPMGEDQLIIVSFTYDRLFGRDTSARAIDRLPWLAAGSTNFGKFSPQPYTQLAKVLREMGHDREARLVLQERERRLAENLLRDQKAAFDAAYQHNKGDSGKIWLSMRGAQAWSWLTRVITGYGYAPHYALLWALGAVTLWTILYFIAYRAGVMVPSSDAILTSTDWKTAFDAQQLAPSLVWQGAARAHYEGFVAGLYALDVFLPVMELGQDTKWTASMATTGGVFVRALTWLLQGAGYLITGLGLAAATGIIQKDRG